MARHDPPTLPISALETHLDYDPATGLLLWKKPTSRHTKPGDEAGHVTATGTIIVSLLKHKIPAATVCWALAHKTYPAMAVDFVNGDRHDLRLSNLCYRSVTRSDSPKATSMRLYRERRKQRDLDAAAREATERMTADYPNIGWHRQHQTWVVYEPPMPGRVKSFNRVVGRTTDHDEAMLISDDFRRNVYLLDDRLDLTADQEAITLGARGYYHLTLGELNDMLAYDNETGVFVWRSPITMAGLQADKPVNPKVPSSPRYVSIRGRRLFGHMLAWFMTYHQWPRPKSILWHDENPSNNAIHNLYLRSEND